jgi:DmsE family decaheme c-type cytochrome
MPSARAVLPLVVLVGMMLGSVFSLPAQKQNQDAFVGSEVCAACHADLLTQVRTTPHAELLQRQEAPPQLRGCEACHGPGRAHVEAGGGRGVGGILTFRTESATARADACLTCHQQEAERFLFRQSEHKLMGIACDGCHTAHRPKAPEHLLRQPTPALCFSCHQEVRQDFALPVRHRVLEGDLTCTACHTPHGSLSRFSLRGVANQTCTKCHHQKEGPFVFEHLASRVEGCTACHTPHGSTTPFLLKRREERILCLECHSDAPLFHNQAAGAFFRGTCTRCHTEIHGSNFDRFFFH